MSDEPPSPEAWVSWPCFPTGEMPVPRELTAMLPWRRHGQAAKKPNGNVPVREVAQQTGSPTTSICRSKTEEYNL